MAHLAPTNFPNGLTTRTPDIGDDSDAVATTEFVMANAGTAGAQVIAGTWNAATNSPALVSSVGTKGTTYVVATAGYTQLDGVGFWNVGDELTFDGTVWRKISGINRIVLTGAQTLWVVGAAGNDATTNGTTFATGFKTIQGAVNAAQTRYIVNGNTFVIQIYPAGGPYTGSIVATGQLLGGGIINLNGNSGTAVIATAGNAITAQNDAVVALTNLSISSSGGKAVYCATGAQVLVQGGNSFGATPAGLHLDAALTGVINITSNYTISGGAVGHIHAETGGFQVAAGITVTLTGTPAFSSYFCGLGGGGGMYLVGTTYSGAATGQKFLLHFNSSIRADLTTDAAIQAFFPGDSAGTADKGAVFDAFGAAPSRQTKLTGQAANFQLSVPAGARVDYLVIGNANANAVTGGINIGTTPGGADVLAAFAVSGNSYAEATPLKKVFSLTAAQILYVTAVTSWNTASVTVAVGYDDIANP